MASLRDHSRPAKHVVIAAAQADLPMARKLWQALQRRGVAGSVNQAQILKGDVTELVVLVSAASMDDMALTEQVVSFRNHKAEPILVSRTDSTTRLPPCLTTVRGPDGLLETANDPIDLGTLDDKARSIETCADQIVGAIGARARHPVIGFARQRAASLGLAAALVIAIPFATLNYQAMDAEREAAQERGEDMRSLLATLSDTFPSDSSEAALLRLVDGLEAELGDTSLAHVDEPLLVEQARLYLALARTRAGFGDWAQARLDYAEAFRRTEAVLARAPDDVERLYAHARSAFSIGYAALRQDDLVAGAEYFDIYAGLTGQLVSAEPDNPVFLAEQSRSEMAAGEIALRHGETHAALGLFDQALSGFSQIEPNSHKVEAIEIARIHGARSLALHDLGELTQAVTEREREIAILADFNQTSAASGTSRMQFIDAASRLAHLQAELGRMDRANNALELADTAIADSQDISADAPGLARAKFHTSWAQTQFDIWAGDFEAARQSLETTRAELAALADRQTGEPYMERAAIHLLAAELALETDEFDLAQLEAMDAALAGERALREGSKQANPLVARAYFVDAVARANQGNLAAAQRNLRQVRGAIEGIDGGRQPDILDLESRTLWHLGEESGALELRAQLEQIGYARPDFVQFWSKVDQGLTAQSAGSRTDNERG